MLHSLLPTLLTFALGVHLAPAQGVEDLDRYVLDELDVARYELQFLPLEGDGGADVALDIVLDGVPATLVLAPYSVRAESFELRVQRADGAIVSVPAPRPATYRGVIAGQPLSRVAAGRIAEGWKVIVVAADGRTWYAQPLAEVVPGSAAGLHLVYRHEDVVLPPDFCGTVAQPMPPPDAGHDAAAGGCLKLAELAWDCDYETYLANGSSVANTIADVDAVTNALNVYYARDVLIEHQITNVIVRTAEPDPYSSYDPGALLDSFVNEWRNNQTGVQRDMAHLATGREVDGNIIGLAYVGVTCNNAWAYGWTQWNLGFGGHVSVAAHELGHNWNAPHCADPCDIMCGGCPYFGPNTTAIILAYRNAVGCLDDGPPYTDPLPPHVLPEFLEITGEVVVDVLANDLDGNCDLLTIDSFDAVSEQGGTVTRSVGSGPGGRDELRYTPVPGFQGLDTFVYRISDGTGNVVDGTVTVTLFDELPNIAAHYALDELSGETMIDSSGHGLDGTFFGPALGQPGAAPETATSVRFDGVSDRAEVPSGSPLSGLRKKLAIAAWVNPAQVSGQNQIFGNGSSWAFGIRDGGLYFTLQGVKDFTLPGAIPAFAWTHVAAVFDEGLDVTFYVNGNSLGTLGGNAQSGLPGAKWVMASAVVNDIYAGRLDDLQIYDHPLTSDEVRALYEHPGLVLEPCAPATTYCQTASNSVGPGAEISSLGSTNIYQNDFELLTYGCPSGQFGIYYYGPNAIELPFGNGYRCVGGAIHRYPVQTVDFFGIASRQVDFDAPPDASGRIEAGSTWCFQFWYRDPAGGGAAYNLSNGLRATFCP
jgi:hypothetical protein